MTEYTNDEILALVAQARKDLESRELSSRPREDIVLAESQQNSPDSAVFLSRPREVYKDKNIKILNDFSRETREETDQTCPSDLLGEDQSPEGLEVKGGGVVSAPPASISSRVFSGITAQHHRTSKGIKVSITLQKADEAEYCAYIELTAELKRSDRIRELKSYSYDSDEFAAHYAELKNQIKNDLTPEERQRVCIGRLHARGSRSAWVADMLVLGVLDDNDVLAKLTYYYDAEYEIEMTQTLTRRQIDLYHSSGIYGTLKRDRTAPTLDTLKRRHF